MTLALAAVIVVGVAGGGSPPSRLDRNLGVVLDAPRLRNLYWDAAWSTHHPAFTRATLNTFSARFGSSGYAAPLAQYGVAAPAFLSSHVASTDCGAARAPDSVTTARVVAWLICEVTNSAAGVPDPGLRVPISNDVYVVYLPSNTTIADGLTIPRVTVLGRSIGPFTVSHNSCTDYGAYHAFATAGVQPFAFAIVPTRCAVTRATSTTPARDLVTAAASHEVVEAATDPFPLASWVDNSLSVAQKLTRGEAADICDFLDAVAARRQTFLWEPFWSNAAGRCVA